MKKIFLAFFAMLLVPFWLFGAASKLSDVLPAQEFYIDLEPKECNKRCLLDLLKKGQIFSFLARFKESLASEELKEKYLGFFRGNFEHEGGGAPSFAPSTSSQKIAIIIPQKTIKSYSMIVSNAILAYSAHAKTPLATEFFLIEDESEIEKALEQIVSREFNYVIAPITDLALDKIADSRFEKIFFYVPTLHANLAKIYRPNIVFGGIDYEGQIKELLKFANSKIASISDGSRLGELLNRHILLERPEAFLSVIASKEVNLKGYLRGQSGFMNASIFLNTTLLKTSLLSSQFGVYDLNVKQLLCTQICYDPALFSLVNQNDRANMLVATSFNEIDENLLANAKMLGIDLRYDRVAYPVMFGVDFILTNFLDKSQTSYFEESVSGSQVIYKTHVFSVKNNSFDEIK